MRTITATNEAGVEHRIRINDDGSISFIWSDDLAEFMQAGEARIERASHVEPTAGGRWSVDMRPSGGPLFEQTFALRGEALAAEVAWLREHRGV